MHCARRETCEGCYPKLIQACYCNYKGTAILLHLETWYLFDIKAKNVRGIYIDFGNYFSWTSLLHMREHLTGRPQKWSLPSLCSRTGSLGAAAGGADPLVGAAVDGAGFSVLVDAVVLLVLSLPCSQPERAWAKASPWAVAILSSRAVGWRAPVGPA